ncbi:phospholipase A2-like isoform X2 [Polyergus mexicanus]|uniref:phospholipase A2-like isoform X2 n=1 Tax=Polyergus mexicanus TaxID=615972 RepID=UPI0038B5FE6E
MRRIHAINLISFCALVLFVVNNDVTEGHSVKDFFKALRGLSQIKNLRHGILPGTLWCGRGNIARDDSELGVYSELDTCCRTHDRCEDSINPKATKYGLYNKYICRSSLCKCDLQFYDCLMRVHGLYASTVGKIYFKKCKQCFRTYYDSEECIRESFVNRLHRAICDRRIRVNQSLCGRSHHVVHGEDIDKDFVKVNQHLC